MNIAQSISEYLSSQQQNMIELLRRLVLSESPSTEPESQKQILQILTDELQDLYYEVEQIGGNTTGGHIYAQPKQHHGRSYQLLLGHCDTVWPCQTLKTMPFIVEEGKIRGPGSYDMKGGLTQMVFALKTLQELQLETQVAPWVFVNSDEEIGSKESSQWIHRLSKSCERVFVLEPSLGESGKLKTARKGIGKFIITIQGKASHAGLAPDQGVSAIVELSYIVQKLFAMNDPEKGISVNVGMIEGGIRPNVVAPESRAVVDVRVLTKQDGERIEKMINSLTPMHPEIVLKIDGKIGRPPMEHTSENRILWQLAQQAAGELGIEIEEATAGGGSDGNTASQYTATLDGLGATGDGAHAQHEFIYVDKMVERTALLTMLLLAPSIKL